MAEPEWPEVGVQVDREKIRNLPTSVYLEKEFRVKLFSKAYEKSGSLRRIAINMGYPSRPGLNGTARDMWLGKRGIGRHKIEYLLKLTGIPIDELINNIVPKDKSVEIDDWLRSYINYKSNRK